MSLDGVVAKLVERRRQDVEGVRLVVARLPERLTVEGGTVALEVLLLALVDCGELVGLKNLYWTGNHEN